MREYYSKNLGPLKGWVKCTNECNGFDKWTLEQERFEEEEKTESV